MAPSRQASTINQHPPTGTYLDSTAHHPLAHKIAVVRSLTDRAELLSSCPQHICEEQLRIHSAMSLNNYPYCFVRKVLTQCSQASRKEQNDNKAFIVIAYVCGLSKAIKRTHSSVDIRAHFKLHTTLYQLISHAKDPAPTSQKSGVVYCTPCNSCSSVCWAYHSNGKYPY